MRGLFPLCCVKLGREGSLPWVWDSTVEFSTDHSHVGSPDWLSRDLTGAEGQRLSVWVCRDWS